MNSGTISLLLKSQGLFLLMFTFRVTVQDPRYPFCNGASIYHPYYNSYWVRSLPKIKNTRLLNSLITQSENVLIDKLNLPYLLLHMSQVLEREQLLTYPDQLDPPNLLAMLLLVWEQL